MVFFKSCKNCCKKCSLLKENVIFRAKMSNISGSGFFNVQKITANALKRAFFPMASSGRLYWLQEKKSECMEAYEKTSLLLTWFLTSVNHFRISLWSQSLVASLLQHILMFIFSVLVPFRVKRDVTSRYCSLGFSVRSNQPPCGNKMDWFYQTQGFRTVVHKPMGWRYGGFFF